MGGPGSGSFPDDGSTHRVGRKKRAAVAVAGSGIPVRPAGLSDEEAACWDEIAESVQGVAYSQDSQAMKQMAIWTCRLDTLNEALRGDPLNVDLMKMANTALIRLSALWSRFGMDPRSRQILLVPKEEEEKDEFERMLDG